MKESKIPQLMPLNWVFSSIMISLILVSACVIYSEKMGGFMIDNNVHEKGSKTDMWFW